MNSIKKNRSHKSKIRLLDKLSIVLGGYAKTQLFLSVLVAIATWILLSFFHVRFALTLAVFTGVVSIVPVFGLLLSAVIAASVAMFDGADYFPNLPRIFDGLVVLISYGALNVLMDYVLSPFLVGKMIKINAFVLLFVVILGTAMFGMLGALFAVPVLLVIKTVIEHYRES